MPAIPDDRFASGWDLLGPAFHNWRGRQAVSREGRLVGRSQDRSFRSLAGLERTASTSRVLNLAAISNQSSGEPDYFSAPFFKSATLNGAVIIKHRLRPDEQYAFERGRRNATKAIIPFERTDLSLGGRSLFVGQRNWHEMLHDLNGDHESDARDIALLEALDELPSLDPFLLREHLRRRDFQIANCYFAISHADLDRMQRFVSGEVGRLVELAYGGHGNGPSANLSKLVSLLLSGQDDTRLEPLRLTLGLQGENFREGIFSWKGFLYYKWVLSSLWPELRGVIAELTQIKVAGPRDPEMLNQVKNLGAQVNQAILSQVRRVRVSLKVYDDAFAEMTQASNPMAFRDFLLKSPEMFMTLGERTGMVSHIASFWRYRFPKGRPARIDLDELFDILQDFHHGLAGEEDVAQAQRADERLLVDAMNLESLGRAAV